MGLSSNSRVTEKIEEQVNLACSAQIWQVKKEVRLPVHYTKEQHSNPHHFFPFLFLYSCLPMYPYYLAWSTENQPTRFSLHIQLQLLCWKTILLLHTDPNAKKILHKRPETKNGMDISASYEAILIWMILFWLSYPTFLIFQNSQ